MSEQDKMHQDITKLLNTYSVKSADNNALIHAISVLILEGQRDAMDELYKQLQERLAS